MIARLLSLLSFGALLAAGCSPIVGGACVPGAIVCDGHCVDPRSDEAHCGGCGAVCDEGRSCVEGHCAWLPADAMPGDVGADDAGWDRDGDVPDAGVIDAPLDAPLDAPMDAPRGDAGADDAPGLDAPGLDAPDLDAPGRDAPELDAPGRDAPRTDAPVDAPASDVPATDGGDVDAGPGPGPCDLGTEPCGSECVDTTSDVTNCGACGRACGGGQLCQGGVCVDRCGPGLVACGSACVDILTDPDHCGGCGHVCPTGLCELGVCTGALAGHLVVIGHSFEVNRAAMDHVLGNAVLLAATRPVRIVPFVGTATSAMVAGARRAIDGTATLMGRTVVFRDEVDETRVPAALANADVLLVYPQAAGTDEDLDRIGTSWSLALATFLARGGVVVVLDAMASHRGTWGIVEAAGLMLAEHHEDATYGMVRIVAPADGVVIGVPLTYRAEPTSTRLFGSDLPVVATDGVAAVVLHRTVVP